MRFNPFNYTKPVDGKGFGGRPNESAQIDYYLKEACSGNLVNMAILGPSQIGKTSLLNYATYKAREDGMLCLPISPWEYSGGEADKIIPPVLRKLLSAPNDQFRTRLGLADATEPSHFALEASEQGFIDEEPPTVFLESEDLLAPVQSLFARYPSLKVLIILDNFDCTPHSSGVLRNLLRLAERLPILLLVATTDKFLDIKDAGQHLSSHFTKIRLGPFIDQYQTYEVIRKALNQAADPDESIDPAHDAVNDIHILSGGNPREINLIAHHISKAYADGRIDRFEVTSDVLDDILNQLGDVPHHETLRKIKELSDEELKELVNIVSHEGLSVQQEGLLRLAFNSFEPSAQQEAEQQVRDIRTKFENLGFIECSDDKFSVVGSEWAKVYLSYRYHKQIGRPYSLPKLSVASYSHLILKKLMKNTIEQLAAAEVDSAPLFNIKESSVDSGLKVSMNRLLEILDQGEAGELYSSSLFIPVMLSNILEGDDIKPITLRFYFSGPEPEGALFIEFPAPTPDSDERETDPTTIVSNMIEDVASVLPLYGLNLEKTEQHTLIKSDVQRFTRLLEAHKEHIRLARRFFPAFEHREFELAERHADDAVEISASLSHGIKTGWVVRRSFVQICNGFGKEARFHLEQVAGGDQADKQTLIARMDLAYLDMESGEFSRAESQLMGILSHIQKTRDSADNTLKLSFGTDDLLR